MEFIFSPDLVKIRVVSRHQANTKHHVPSTAYVDILSRPGSTNMLDGDQEGTQRTNFKIEYQISTFKPYYHHVNFPYY